MKGVKNRIRYNTYSDELLAVFSTSQFKAGQAKLMSSRPPAMAQSSDSPYTQISLLTVYVRRSRPAPWSLPFPDLLKVKRA